MIDRPGLKNKGQVIYLFLLLRFILSLVHLTIWKVTAGFIVFKNTWARNVKVKMFFWFQRLLFREHMTRHGR